MKWLTDSGIIVALIGATGTVLAAVLPKLVERSAGTKSRRKRRETTGRARGTSAYSP